MAVNSIVCQSGSQSNIVNVDVQNSETNSDDDDYEGLHYRKFISLLRRWNQTEPVTLQDIRFYMRLNNIPDGTRKIQILLYKGMKRNDIRRSGEFGLRKYVLVNKKNVE